MSDVHYIGVHDPNIGVYRPQHLPRFDPNEVPQGWEKGHRDRAIGIGYFRGGNRFSNS